MKTVGWKYSEKARVAGQQGGRDSNLGLGYYLSITESHSGDWSKSPRDTLVPLSSGLV